jgi:hypothetical protein
MKQIILLLSFQSTFTHCMYFNSPSSADSNVAVFWQWGISCVSFRVLY